MMAREPGREVDRGEGLLRERAASGIK